MDGFQGSGSGSFQNHLCVYFVCSLEFSFKEVFNSFFIYVLFNYLFKLNFTPTKIHEDQSLIIAMLIIMNLKCSLAVKNS